MSLSNGGPFDEIIADVAAKLYDKKISTGTIPKDLYEQTAARLMDSVFAGLGGKSFEYEDPRNNLVTYLRQNVYSFSAAKSLTQMREFNDLLTGPDGELRSKAAFVAEVAKTGALFNKTWLETEQANAVAQAQMAEQWDSFASDDYLQVSTAGDDKVRPWHASLDGFTALKSDPVWRRLWPPFDWNCRCHVVPGIAKNVRDFKTSALLKEARVPDYFQSNSGLTRTAFSNDHVYYRNSFGKEKELTAIDNYGMQTVNKLYASNDFTTPELLQSKEEANAWWTTKAGEQRGSIDIKDKLGTVVRFDNKFRLHILEDNKDDRHQLVALMPQVLKDPDEVWSIRTAKGLETVYIRYYENWPVMIRVNETRAFTMLAAEHNGKVNESTMNNMRRGILMYRKN